MSDKACHRRAAKAQGSEHDFSPVISGTSPSPPDKVATAGTAERLIGLTGCEGEIRTEVIRSAWRLFRYSPLTRWLAPCTNAHVRSQRP